MSLARLASTQLVQPTLRAQGAVPAQREDRFDQLTKYIPTETVTFYVAAVALKAKDATPFESWSLYAAGALITPLALYAIGFAKQRAANPQQPFRPQAWPVVAAVLAYLVWALAVPGGAPISDDARHIASIGALFVSTILALADPIFRAAPPALVPNNPS
jgi:hypothetical protein